MILALETSTDICSVALQVEQANVVERRTEQKGSHSEQLFQFIKELMMEHRFAVPELECMLVSEGPGSYTGLRIGAGAVKGLLFDTDVPLFAINTLAGFAEAARSANPGLSTIHAVIDARREHLYYQEFNVEKGVITTPAGAEIRPIEEIQNLIQKDDAIIGTGIDRLERSFLGSVNILGRNHISARSLITLYGGEQSTFVRKISPDSFDPKYYRSKQGGRGI